MRNIMTALREEFKGLIHDFRYCKIDSHQIRVLRIEPHLTVDGLIQCQLNHVGLKSQHVCLSYM